jgi:GcrA cell cycle regulator
MLSATWTPERVEQLQAHISAGLTCSQIADQIGVTRNAVIGKLHRMGIARGRPPAAPRQRETDTPRRRLSPRRMLRSLFAQPEGTAPDEPEMALMTVDSPHPCSLLDLTQNHCRFPLNSPGDANFAFCGNASIAGFSYCSGHTRMAYRVSRRA